MAAINNASPDLLGHDVADEWQNNQVQVQMVLAVIARSMKAHAELCLLVFLWMAFSQKLFASCFHMKKQL